MDLVYLAGNLASVARTYAAMLPKGAAPTLERLDALDAMFETHKNTMERLRSWVIATGDEALRVVRELWPTQERRIGFFEKGRPARIRRGGTGLAHAAHDLRRELRR